jgi:hypothetical protein
VRQNTGIYVKTRVVSNAKPIAIYSALHSYRASKNRWLAIAAGPAGLSHSRGVGHLCFSKTSLSGAQPRAAVITVYGTDEYSHEASRSYAELE